MKVRLTASLEYDCRDTSKPMGYSIIVTDAGGRILDDYRAGNAPWESTQCIPPSDPNALSKETLLRYAEQTAKEMVEELQEKGHTVEWGGGVCDDEGDCITY